MVIIHYFDALKLCRIYFYHYENVLSYWLHLCKYITKTKQWKTIDP
jgi:hypothetical protein